MTTIRWKQGFASLYKGADAAKCAAEIESIGEAVTPEEIVCMASDSSTELHKCFEWDDTIAASKYRLYQARQIVGHIVYENSPDREDEPQVRVFHKIADSTGYRPTTRIMQNEDEYAKMLKKAYSELKHFADKYRRLSELEPVIEAIDRIA